VEEKKMRTFKYGPAQLIPPPKGKARVIYLMNDERPFAYIIITENLYSDLLRAEKENRGPLLLCRPDWCMADNFPEPEPDEIVIKIKKYTGGEKNDE
jgi:hypothetical protein